MREEVAAEFRAAARELLKFGCGIAVADAVTWVFDPPVNPRQALVVNAAVLGAFAFGYGTRFTAELWRRIRRPSGPQRTMNPNP